MLRFCFWCRKLLMRWTVLSSDALVFFPAVLYFLYVYYHGRNSRNSCEIAWHMVMLLINPCLILIDHGHFQVFEHHPVAPSPCSCVSFNWNSLRYKFYSHFGLMSHSQYNCISLGFTVGAVAAVLSNRDLLASSLFCLALNHKQVSISYWTLSLIWMIVLSSHLDDCFIIHHIFGTYLENWCHQSWLISVFLVILIPRVMPLEVIGCCVILWLLIIWLLLVYFCCRWVHIMHQPFLAISWENA